MNKHKPASSHQSLFLPENQKSQHPTGPAAAADRFPGRITSSIYPTIGDPHHHVGVSGKHRARHNDHSQQWVDARTVSASSSNSKPIAPAKRRAPPAPAALQVRVVWPGPVDKRQPDRGQFRLQGKVTGDDGKPRARMLAL